MSVHQCECTEKRCVHAMRGLQIVTKASLEISRGLRRNMLCRMVPRLEHGVVDVEFLGTYVAYYAPVLGTSNQIDGLQFAPNPPKLLPVERRLKGFLWWNPVP